ncbi:type IV pilus modification protein PilV [Ramlibacter henchirensis]|uniref:Type IV pilus modification protein PilV n=1 Tax=Ramlibacter henchirensis TaxID=204072 RepID=A0A4Z0C6S4_9BURK|nr:type IV pilus modification protein PilV [Ramlibacter henchirensis]TFZ06078.1 type IV pilus modification protein PilV [Ramlibacter henchirensis]
MDSRDPSKRQQTGATLIEVLVSLLVLAFGMLSLSSLMAFAVQMPKLSGYRATAAILASGHVEKIRANRQGFAGGHYATTSSYDGSFNEISAVPCEFPNCTVDSLALMDDAATKRAVRQALPAGGVMTVCDPMPCNGNSMGSLWIMWQEPDTRSLLDPASSDNCPGSVISNYTNPRPRCIYLRFTP